MSERHFPKAYSFKAITIGPNGSKAFAAVAYTVLIGGDQVVIAAPDAASAYRRATAAYGPYLSEAGSQEVVIVSAKSFAAMLACWQEHNEILEARNSQHVLKAEGASPDATDRENCANASPDGGPMGDGQAAAAAPDGNSDTSALLPQRGKQL